MDSCSLAFQLCNTSVLCLNWCSVLVICPTLNLENGKVDYHKSPVEGGYPVDTIAVFTCKHGYYHNDSFLSFCQTSGHWTQETPTCIQSNENHIDLCYCNFNELNIMTLRFISDAFGFVYKA